jgi:hypothetical protein
LVLADQRPQVAAHRSGSWCLQLEDRGSHVADGRVEVRHRPLDPAAHVVADVPHRRGLQLHARREQAIVADDRGQGAHADEPSFLGDPALP